MNYRIVHVISESLWRSKRRWFMSFWGDDEQFISLAELVKTMDHGEPGLYIVRGI